MLYVLSHNAGTVKQTLAFDDVHGQPNLLDICKDYLAAVTNKNIVRVYKVAGREAKPHAGPGKLICIVIYQPDWFAVKTIYGAPVLPCVHLA